MRPDDPGIDPEADLPHAVGIAAAAFQHEQETYLRNKPYQVFSGAHRLVSIPCP